MKILIPYTVTDAVLSSSTIAEPAPGETAWVSAGTYAVGDLRIRATTHRVYRCVLAHTGRTALPEADPTYWQDAAPTQRWALFDSQVSTQSAATTSMTVVLRPGFVNAMALYGVDAATIVITLKDAPGGTTIKTTTVTMQEPPLDWYDWAFGRIKPLTKLVLEDLIPYPDAEITITLSAAMGATVKCGMVIVGDMRDLLDSAEFGGTEYGATAEPVDYSYIKTDDYGNTTIVKRRNVTDMSCKLFLPQAQADTALATIQEVLGTPAAWIATDVPGYAGLNTFGLGSASVSYDSFANATISIKVKALV